MSEGKGQQWKGVERLARDCSTLPAKYFGQMEVNTIGDLLLEHREKIESDMRERLVPLLEAAENACEVHAEKHPTSVIHKLERILITWK